MATPDAEVELAELVVEVTAMTDAATGAEAVMNGNAARLDGLLQTATDFAALKTGVAAESALLKAKAAEVAAAVVANTPAAP